MTLQHPGPFPIHVFPPHFRAYVEQSAEAIQCDPASVAMPLIAAAGAAMGGSRVLELKKGWQVHPMLWVALISPTGTVKTPAVNAGLKPLISLEKRLWRDHQEEIQAWQQANPDGPPEDSPRGRTFIIGDATIESLPPLLRDNPRGVLSYNDELAGWVKSHNAYRPGSDTEQWLQIFDGNALRVHRKGHEPIYVPHARVAVVGTIQPKVFNECFSGANLENGLASRFLVFRTQNPKRRWHEITVDAQIEETVLSTFEGLIHLGMDERDNAWPEPLVVRLDRDAAELWAGFYDGHQEELEGEDDEAIRGALAKMDGYTARIALVLNGISPEAFELFAEPGVVLRGDVMQRAIEVATWLIDQARYCYGSLAASQQEQLLQQVVQRVTQGIGDREPGTTSARDLQRHMRAFSEDVQQAKQVMAQIVERGLGVIESETADNGRSVEVLRISPRMSKGLIIEDSVDGVGVDAGGNRGVNYGE
ncbi:DUF3987 domain-containing protein [Mucisphaera sp.]|uniref:DUF3987 domain-containing protein n=1 Tax=Mucisphaera sp. TaxID=2913024 RepID=UPI003D10B1AE